MKRCGTCEHLDKSTMMTSGQFKCKLLSFDGKNFLVAQIVGYPDVDFERVHPTPSTIFYVSNTFGCRHHKELD